MDYLSDYNTTLRVQEHAHKRQIDVYAEAQKKEIALDTERRKQEIISEFASKRAQDAFWREIFKREYVPTVYRTQQGQIMVAHVIDNNKIATTKLLDVDVLRSTRYYTKHDELLEVHWTHGSTEKTVRLLKTADIEGKFLSMLKREGLHVLAALHPDICFAFLVFILYDAECVEIPEKWGWNMMTDGRYVFCDDSKNMEDMKCR